MENIQSRISRRLFLEDTVEKEKDVHDSDYDRQRAEDLLYHTIGPLTTKPRWSGQWTSDTEPPESFVPHGNAPRWTVEELVMAYAGDPALLSDSGSRDNPRSPKYGTKGGSPLYRAARKIAKHYGKQGDSSYIEELYSNGMIVLLRNCQAGQDQSRSPFISFVSRSVNSAMLHGVGGEARTSSAVHSDKDIKGLRAILDETNPNKVRKAASIVGGKFRDERSHELSTENPFGVFSYDYYNLLMNYAGALESGDDANIQNNKSDIRDLIQKIEDYSIHIPGASTGVGQAVSTSDRNKNLSISNINMDHIERLARTNDATVARRLGEIVDERFRSNNKNTGNVSSNNPYGIHSPKFYTLANKLADALRIKDDETINSIRDEIQDLMVKIEKYKNDAAKYAKKITSVDVPVDDSGSTLAGSLPGGSSSTEENISDMQEATTYLLEIALKTDISSVLSGSIKYKNIAKQLGAKEGKIGGALTVNEFRYLIRSLGSQASNYPGKGNIRTNIKIPRDSRGWWKPFEDPEIEPFRLQNESISPIINIPQALQSEYNANSLWRSYWMRNGYKSMGPTEIAQEMTNEVEEFNRYGIPTDRKITVKKNKSEAVSKVAIFTALNAAKIKIMIISDTHSEDVGRVGRLGYDEPSNDSEGYMDESIGTDSMRVLVENVRRMPRAERLMVVEAADNVIRCLDKVLNEASPKGFKALKHKNIKNSLTLNMKNKGYQSNYNESGNKIHEGMLPVD